MCFREVRCYVVRSRSMEALPTRIPDRTTLVEMLSWNARVISTIEFRD